MVGTELNGRYMIEQLIGTGGMADVYRAKDNLLGRTVAVKILHPQFAKDPVFIQRFRHEAQAAANLSQPQIVNVYDWGIEGEVYYLVMEYVQGRDLKSLIKQGGPLMPERAVEIAIAITEALEAAHAGEIVHRDIKPQNIIVTNDNDIKVMDFGIARSAGGSAMTQTGTIMGTAQYISPEQAQGQAADPRSDLYSLGIVLYEMLTAKVPFDGETPVSIAYKHVREDPLPPSMINPDVSPELEAVVMKALAKNPENRYQNAVEMRADLERLLEGTPVYATPVLSPDEAAKGATAAYPLGAGTQGRRSRAWIWIIVVMILVAGAAAAAIAIVSSSSGVQVPNVVGQTEQQATQTLSQKGLKLSVSKRVIDMEKPADVVISQDPGAGSKISKNGTVEVVVSKGPELVTVPECRGVSETEATARLNEAGLKLGEVTQDFSETVPKDKVAEQNPEAGARVSKATSVNLIVSKGPEMVGVPNVIGLTQDAATTQLEGAGLVAEVASVSSTTQPEGTVIAQNPESGTRVAKGSKVTISVVKKPELATVPSVITQTQSAAETALTNAGFTVTVIDKQVTDPTQKGKVVDQSPTGGTQAEKGSKVTIYVGITAGP